MTFNTNKLKLLTSKPRKKGELGALATELMVAVVVLTVGILPIAFSYIQETKMARALYYRSVAMEIVDGEMEILRAGEWRAFPKGQRVPYAVRAQAAKNLPRGKFELEVRSDHIRLEWSPEKRDQGGQVFREVKVP